MGATSANMMVGVGFHSLPEIKLSGWLIEPSRGLQRNTACIAFQLIRYVAEANINLQAEQQRIEALDGIIRTLFQGREVFPNFPPTRDDEDDSESLPAVLDCGFGGGGWIERMLEEYQGNLDMTGVDIFLGHRDSDDEDNGDDSNGNGNDIDPVQEYDMKRWNLNASFRDDKSTDRLRPESFDLINSRYLAEGINTNRWPSYVRELRLLLKPGGWLQMVEIQFPFQSSSGLLPDESHLTQWWEWYSWALHRMGRNVRIGRELGQLLTAQGFQDVRPVVHDVPIGDWNPDQATLGRSNLEVAERMLYSLSLFPFLHSESMSQDRYRALINGARAELRNPEYKLYYRVYIAVGQRPPG